MSKSNVLELAKKLVAAIEKEDQKNKVMLKDIRLVGSLLQASEDSLYWNRKKIPL